MRISPIASALLLAPTAAGATACQSEKATEPDMLPSGTTVFENSFSGSARYLANDTLGVYCSMTVSFAWDSTRTGAAGEQLPIKGTRTPDGFWKGDWSCASTGRVAAPADIAGLAVGTWQTLVVTVR